MGASFSSKSCHRSNVLFAPATASGGNSAEVNKTAVDVSVSPTAPKVPSNYSLQMFDLTFLLAFQYLPLSTVCTLRRVSHSFSSLTRHPMFWSSFTVITYSRSNPIHYPPIAALLGLNATCNPSSKVFNLFTSSFNSSVTLSAPLPPLGALSFHDYDLHSSDVEAICRLSKLRSLRIHRCFSHLLDLCNALHHCVGLKELVLNDCILTNGCVVAISSCSQIERLNLSNNRLLTSDCCLSIAEMGSLKELVFNSRSIYDAGITSLTLSPDLRSNLTSLSCSGLDSLTNLSMMNISESFKQLRSLNIRWCSLINDDGIMHLSELPHLEQLCMSELKLVTEAGVQELIRKTSLKEVDLRWCKLLGKEWRDRLKEERPNWKV